MVPSWLMDPWLMKQRIGTTHQPHPNSVRRKNHLNSPIFFLHPTCLQSISVVGSIIDYHSLVDRSSTHCSYLLRIHTFLACKFAESLDATMRKGTNLKVHQSPHHAYTHRVIFFAEQIEETLTWSPYAALRKGSSGNCHLRRLKKNWIC